MMKSIVALLLAVVLCSAEPAQNSSCVSTYNTTSGTITALGLIPYTDCTFYLTPPSADYQYVTLTFILFNTEYSYDVTYIYDGPDNSSSLINALSGNIGTRVMKTSQPYATIRFTTNGYLTDATGWELSFQYSTEPAPTCAGPTYISDFNGELTYDLLGKSTDQVNCEWIFVPYASPAMYCYNQFTFSMTSWEDTSNSAMVALWDSPGTDINMVGFFNASDTQYIVNIDDGAAISSLVTPFDGSVTSFTIQYSLDILCDYPDFSSSSSSSSKDYTWLWVTMAGLGCISLISLVALVIRYQKRTHEFRNLVDPETASMVPITQTPKTQSYGSST